MTETGEGYKVVSVPEEIFARMNLIEGDIVTDPIKPYDVVVCTAVLSYYSREFMSNSPEHELEQKVISSVKDDGFLISPLFPGNDFELLEFSYNPSPSIHNETASLLHRRRTPSKKQDLT